VTRSSSEADDVLSGEERARWCKVAMVEMFAERVRISDLAKSTRSRKFACERTWWPGPEGTAGAPELEYSEVLESSWEMGGCWR